jgi:hypothetical protein
MLALSIGEMGAPPYGNPAVFGGVVRLYSSMSLDPEKSPDGEVSRGTKPTGNRLSRAPGIGG